MKMINKFRQIEPKRTYTGDDLSDYKRYKDQLRIDFHKRCGYTDCPDFWFGGKSNFHIDHFLPRSKYPELECKYSNLVYSCSFVNRAKSDDEGSYLDPCDNDFNDFFYRDEHGNIYPEDSSSEAKYMYKKLKLYLDRYGIIWMLDFIDKEIDLLSTEIKKIKGKDKKNKLLEMYYDLSEEFRKYKKYLEVELD